MHKLFKLLVDQQKRTAELQIYGDITSTSWFEDDSTPKKLANELEKIGDVDQLIVRINSYGGDVFAGQAILSILKRQKCEVVTYIEGIAASAASVIAMAGKCVMPKNAMMMIHNAWTLCIGDSSEMRKTADTLDKIGLAVIEAYKAKTGLKDEKIKEIMQQESWLTAQECFDLGFCDEIDDQEIEMSINGLKVSPSKLINMAYKQKNNHKNININSNTEYTGVKKMDLLQLCTNVGLDYNLLKESGLNDDKIRAMALEIKLKNTENSISNASTGNLEPQNSDVSINVELSTDNILNIINLCQDQNVDPKPFIQNGSTIENVKASIFDLKQQQMPAVNSNNIQVGTDENSKFMNAASDAVLLRAGINLRTPHEASSELRSMRLRDLAIECCERAGFNNARRLSDNELFRLALTPDSQFSSILSTAANKSLSTAYQEATTTYKAWTQKASLTDFKAATKYQMSEAGNLKVITQTGEFKKDEMTDQGVSRSLITYGIEWGITRQAMINDDLSALSTMPAKYINAAERNINYLVYKKLADTSLNIFDGTTLFTSGHGNLAGTPAAISVTSIGLAKAAMRKQKGIRSKAQLNITPAFLIVPPDIETPAEQLVFSYADPASANSEVKNIFMNKLQVVCDAELDQYDSNAWYLAANNSMVDTIEVGYLNGNEQATLESAVQFDYLGVKFHLFQDVSVAVIDYKGLYKNAGA